MGVFVKEVTIEKIQIDSIVFILRREALKKEELI